MTHFNSTNTVTACMSNTATKECIGEPESMTENSMAGFIITTPGTNAEVIASIQTMELFNADSMLTYTVIDNGVVNPHISVDEYGSKKVVVSTRLISAFFSRSSDESIIEVSGTLLMKFGSSGSSRKLERFGRLEVGSKNSEAVFHVNFVIVSSSNEVRAQISRNSGTDIYTVQLLGLLP